MAIEAFVARFSPVHLIAAIPKRVRFVISSFFLGACLLASIAFGFDKSFIFLPMLLIATYMAVFFSVLDGVEKVEWYMLFITPLILTTVAYLYFFLLPTRWLTRLPYVVIYMVCIYAVLLTSNVLNVGVERGLQLYRAAFSVNFFFQTFCMFLFTQVFWSFKASPLLQATGVATLAILLSLQLFWSAKPRLTLDFSTLPFVWTLGVVMFQLVLLVCFINAPVNVVAIFCTGIYYCLSSILYFHIDGRLFESTVREYIFAAVAVTLLFLLAINY